MYQIALTTPSNSFLLYHIDWYTTLWYNEILLTNQTHIVKGIVTNTEQKK